MFISAVFTSLALATVTLASPMKRATVQCPGLNVFDSVNNITSFTLLAVNVDDTSVQRPLSIGAATRSGGLDVIATTESLADPKTGSFSMLNSAITAVITGFEGNETSNDLVDGTGFLSFSPESTPAEIYCGLIDTDPAVGSPFPLELAVGTSDGSVSTQFSICQTSLGLDVVIFDPAADTSGAFEASTCVPVTVAIIDTQ